MTAKKHNTAKSSVLQAITSYRGGPGMAVTAAFVGPGTVITASLAGANFGFSLIWALVFSIIASLVLQEMSARLGLITQQGLGENLVTAFDSVVAKRLMQALILIAIVIGNGAYQAGNLSGATIGITSVLPLQFNIENNTYNLWPLILGAIVLALLQFRSYRLVERALILLVAIMSLVFLLTFIAVDVDYTALAKGFVPSLPSGSVLTAIALIGTTVVPYNLFLHASAVKERWRDKKDLTVARVDLVISVPIGGLISVAILSIAATVFFANQLTIKTAADLSPALAPLVGDSASILMALGLFAAGITSAITAPLAAAYALSGIFGFQPHLSDKNFLWVSRFILISGVILASLSYKPMTVIWAAQVANGLLLPIVSGYLVMAMNQPRLAEYRNNIWQNAVAISVWLISVMLGARSLFFAFGWL